MALTRKAVTGVLLPQAYLYACDLVGLKIPREARLPLRPNIPLLLSNGGPKGPWRLAGLSQHRTPVDCCWGTTIASSRSHHVVMLSAGGSPSGLPGPCGLATVGQPPYITLRRDHLQRRPSNVEGLAGPPNELPRDQDHQEALWAPASCEGPPGGWWRRWPKEENSAAAAAAEAAAAKTAAAARGIWQA